MKKLYSLLCLLGISFMALSQTYQISQGGTLNACTGLLVDDGGAAGPYTDATYTITLCPDNPGDVIQLAFTEFSLQTSGNANNNDRLFIYDGPNTSSPTLGDYSGDQLEGLNATGTVFNASGCLTLRFVPAGAPNTTFTGFSANISCTTPCDNPVSSSAIIDPTPDALDVVNVCPDEQVTFSSQGSIAQPGFTISRWIWNFDDGTVISSTTGGSITHNFAEPGGYNVTLVVEDDNGCQSLNLEPLQVFVSTLPVFSGIQDIITETCFGEPVVMNAGAVQNITWTALPPTVFSTPTYLSDDAGFTFENSITFDFFEPGATLTDCNQLLGINIDIEHSYMGDLVIFVECPNGTAVEMTNDVGFSCFLGQATDGDEFTDAENIPGVGYNYTWSPTATNGTWGDNSTGNQETYVGTDGQTYTNDVLPAGTYEASGDICQFEGCPLNGAWTISLTDDAGSDNGNLFSWSIDFAPSLFPDVPSFTPTIGLNADSSFWSGPNMVGIDFNLDNWVLDPPAPGPYTYTYNVVNSFGCAFDTTITVTFTPAMGFSAGPDLLYVCGDLSTQASFDGMPAPTCSQDAGTFTYCYANNDFLTWNICPDNPGDGTAMTLSFLTGQTEFGFDQFTIYNGPDASFPMIEDNIDGDLTGLSWTSTDPSGCLTAVFGADGSVDCTGGAEAEWTYTIGCTSGGPDFTWEWSPAGPLANPNEMNTVINGLTQQTDFTLTGYPVGHPLCAASDVMTVFIDPAANPGVDTFHGICPNDPAFFMTDVMNGNPVSTGTWTDPTGNVIADGMFDPATDAPGNYVYSVGSGNCILGAVLTIDFPLPVSFELRPDTAICYGSAIEYGLMDVQNGVAPYTFSWDFNSAFLTNDATTSFPVATESGTVCATVTDACQTATTLCTQLTVEDPIVPSFEIDTTRACFPASYNLWTNVPSSSYAHINWILSDGTTVVDDDSITYSPGAAGVYDLDLQFITDLGCEYDTTVSDLIYCFAPPLADWTAEPNPAISLDPLVTFLNSSEGDSLTYLWAINDGTSTFATTEENPVFLFPRGIGGEYPVVLTVTDVNGCTDIWQNDVIVNDLFQSFIPTSFTPNFDGVNDVFKFIGTDIDPDRFRFSILNRWGDVVFETTDPDTGWMANDQMGEYFVQNEVYIWRATVTSKSTGEKKEMTGTVVVIR